MLKRKAVEGGTSHSIRRDTNAVLMHILRDLFILVLIGSLELVSSLHIGDSTAIKKEAPVDKSESMTLSLWLMPPKNPSKKIHKQIDTLATEYGGPSFEPHVTVVGQIPCASEEEATAIANRLQAGLKEFGKIPCLFSGKAFTSKGVWNQAIFFTMEQSAPFMNLCQKSRALLGMDTDNWTFAPPVNMPHLSLFYGTENIPDKSTIDLVSPFYAQTLKLIRTDPSTIESVPNWTEIATISIRSSSDDNKRRRSHEQQAKM